MARRAQKNTIGSAVKNANYTTPAPPDGITLTDDEQVVWEQACRARQEWIEFELILLAKIVKIEVQIRGWWKQMVAEPAIIENNAGRLVENPIIKLINSTQQTQLAIITKLHIMDRGVDSRQLNNPVKVSEKPEAISNFLKLLA